MHQNRGSLIHPVHQQPEGPLCTRSPYRTQWWGTQAKARPHGVYFQGDVGWREIQFKDDHWNGHHSTDEEARELAQVQDIRAGVVA